MVLVVKSLPASAGRCKRHRFDPWVRKIPWKRAWQPTPVFLPGGSCGQRSLAGYCPWGYEELDRTEVTENVCNHKKCKVLCLCIGWASQVALVVKNLPANAGDVRDTGPGSGRSPGREHGNPLQYSCSENPMDRGAWQATVHRIGKSQTQLK